MRFTAYLGACAALVAATQAADIGSVNEVPVALGAPALAEAETEVEVEAGIYLEIEADADAEAEAYLQAGLKSGADAVAYAEALAEYKAYLMAQVQNEGQAVEPEVQAQIDAMAENIFTDFFSSAWDEINTFYNSMKDKAERWGADVNEGFGKMVEEGRNLRVSTVSKMIARGIKGMNAFQEIGHEYTDHCATSETPMSFEEFFKQTTFYNGDGDWPTYEALHKSLGEEPALDSYLTLRRDARTPDMVVAVKEMHKNVDKVVKFATKQGIKAESFETNKLNPLPQAFYDMVAQHKGNANPFATKEDDKKDAKKDDKKGAKPVHKETSL